MISIEEIEDQAADWLIAMWESEMTEERWAAFGRWLAADPRHEKVFTQMEQVVLWLKQNRAHLSASGNAQLPVSIAQHTPSAQERLQRPAVVRHWSVVAGLAAAVLVIVAMGLAFWRGGFAIWKQPAPAAAFVTANSPGLTQAVRLKDGSLATLNSDTKLQVDFSRNRRGVSVEQGEVLLAMAHDPRRPVVARAGDTTVRAAGGTFALRLQNDGGERVLVADGSVEVLAGKGAFRKVLDAGQLAVITPDRVTIRRLSPDDIDRKLAWVKGMVSFYEEPLEQVVAEFNQHHKRKLRIADPHLGQKPVSGRFRIADIDGFAETLRRSGIVADVRKTDTEIVLMGRGRGSSAAR